MCGAVGRCGRDTEQRCECDAGDGDARWDETYLVDKAMLPVTQLCMGLPQDGGEQEDRRASFYVGELVCAPTQRSESLMLYTYRAHFFC
jgi:hypothetical protein